MKWLSSTAFGFLALAASQAPAIADECGSITIANMDWQSAEVLAEIDKIILGVGYGCDAQLVPGTTVSTLTSMVERGQPDVAPEAWVDTMRELVDRGIAEKKIVSAGPALSEGGEQGWYIPKYFSDAHPEIKTVTDVLKHPDYFPAPEDSSKGAIFNCCQGDGGAVIASQFFKAYDAEKKGFTLVDTGSVAALDGSIARAYERKEAWLGFYWSPTALLGKYPLVRLEFEPHFDEAEWKRCNTVIDCPDPRPNNWPKDRVETIVTAEFAERGGAAMEYLKTRSWSNDVVNTLAAWMTDNQATGEQGAAHFLKNNEDIWTKWVPAPVADQVRNSVN